MKLSTMFINYIILTLILILFQNLGSIDPSSGNIDYLNITSQDNINASTGEIIDSTAPYTSSIWWRSVFNPNNWGIGILGLLIGGIVVIIAGYSLAALLTQSYPSDTFLFAPFFVVTVGFGLIPSGLVYSLIQAELSPIMCGPAIEFCMLPSTIGVVVGTFLFVPWLFACIKNWRTGSD